VLDRGVGDDVPLGCFGGAWIGTAFAHLSAAALAALAAAAAEAAVVVVDVPRLMLPVEEEDGGRIRDDATGMRDCVLLVDPVDNRELVLAVLLAPVLAVAAVREARGFLACDSLMNTP
jgi:hypothetical protein